MISLSIIIPVYNVEKYIRDCIESIFRQGLSEDCFEVIIINDGTKDKSMEMIQDIISQHSNTVVVNQKNQGLSVVRNNGIAMAKGDYILMPDSDDLLIDNSLPTMLEKARASKADLVVADFMRMSDEQIVATRGTIKQKEDIRWEEKDGERLFLENLSPYECFVWRTLYRREFLTGNQLQFVPGIYIQDVPFTHECYLKARRCVRTSWTMNIYRQGHESATFRFNIKKEKDFCTAIAETWALRQMQGISADAERKLRNDVYTSFSVMICSTVHAIEDSSQRIEIIDHLRQIAPNLRFNNGIKQRIVSWMLRYVPHTFIKLRHFYGKIVEDKIFPLYHHKLKHQ